MLAVQPAGKGRTAVFTGDTTRNWQQVPRALDLESPFLRFWGQLDPLARQPRRPLAPRRPRHRPAPTRPTTSPMNPSLLEATVRDAQGEGTPNAAGHRHALMGPAQESPSTVQLTPVTGSPGTYTATLESPAPGAVTIEVEADPRRPDPQGRRTPRHRGRPPQPGIRSPRPRRRPAHPHRRRRQGHLPPLQRGRPPPRRARPPRSASRQLTLEQPLYQPWPFWTLLVGLLAPSGILRKRFQLR